MLQLARWVCTIIEALAKLSMDDSRVIMIGLVGHIRRAFNNTWLADRFPIGIACLMLLAVVSQITSPLAANTPCGLIIPHEHILIGRADESDLEGHLEAEANCAAGKGASAVKQTADLHGHKGIVLNVIRIDQHLVTNTLNLIGLATALLALAAVLRFQPLSTRLGFVEMLGHSVELPPPKPPPVTA